MSGTRVVQKVFLAWTAAFLITGLGLAAEWHRITKSVAPERAETARVELRLRAGLLQVEGGAEKLMEAEFVVGDRRWEPVVAYHVRDRRGLLTVRQPRRGSTLWMRNRRNEWDIRLGGMIPLELIVDLDAGEGDLDLRELSMTGLNVDMDAGELRVNMRGKWVGKGEVPIEIQNDIGEIRLRLPRDVGVRVDAHVSLGDVQVRGLRKIDDVYVNDAYQESGLTLNIRIRVKIGDIVVIG